MPKEKVNNYFEMNKELKIKYIESDLLLLDTRNPRFLSIIEDYEKYKKIPNCKNLLRNQQAIVNRLEKESNLNVLINSILTIGYLPIEPIIIVKTDCIKDKINKPYYIVIEGNRRIASIKIILGDPAKLDSMNEGLHDTLNKIPCIVLNPNDDKLMMNILGIRHLVAIEDWPLLQKAIMVGELYKEFNNDDTEVAESFGIGIRETKRLIRAIAIYNWMILNLDVDSKIMEKKSFDIFTEFIKSSAIKKWIGYIEDSNNLLEPEISNFENIEKVGIWIAENIIKSGRFDIRALGEILTKAERESILERIDENNSPSEVLYKIEAQEQMIDTKRIISNLRLAIKSLNSIPASDIGNLNLEDFKVIYKLKSTTANIINIAVKLGVKTK